MRSEKKDGSADLTFPGDVLDKHISPDQAGVGIFVRLIIHEKSNLSGNIGRQQMSFDLNIAGGQIGSTRQLLRAESRAIYLYRIVALGTSAPVSFW